MRRTLAVRQALAVRRISAVQKKRVLISLVVASSMLVLAWLAFAVAAPPLPAYAWPEPGGDSRPADPAFVKAGAAVSGTVGWCEQDDPCGSIQYAIAQSEEGNGDTLYIGAGTYTGTTSAVISITKAITLYGGWDGAASGEVRRDPNTYTTILDGEGQRRGVYIAGSVTVILDGLYITGGDATGLGGGASADAGGGLYAVDTTLILSNTTLTGNAASQSGTGYGGGAYLERATARMVDNSFSDNIASTGDQGGGGGGLYCVDSTAYLRGNLIQNNSGGEKIVGGGLYLANSEATLINNAVIDNVAKSGGAGLYTSNTRAKLLHNTIARNQPDGGNGIEARTYSTVWLTNTIIADHAVGVVATLGNTAIIDGVLWDNNSSGNTAGSGSISVTHAYTGSPAFAADGFHLSSASTALDRGVPTGVTNDFDGDARPQGAGPELGADEIPDVPVLSIAKRGPEIVTPLRSAPVYGGMITYTLTVTNSGPVAATNIVITDTLPASAHYVRGGTLRPDNTVRWELPTLEGGNTQHSVSFVVTSTETLTNSTYRVSCDEGISATGQVAVVTIIGYYPRLQISKQAPTKAAPGDLITYTITITNSGTITATNLLITDTLPSGAHYIQGGELGVNNVINWRHDELGIGDQVQVHFAVTSTQTITNENYYVTSSGKATAVGRELVVTIMEYAPKLRISKDGPPLVARGAPITYTLTVTNSGLVTATNLVITDALPLPAYYVRGGDLLPERTVGFTLDALPPGGITQMQFVVTATDTLVNNAYRVSCAEGAAATGEQWVITTVDAPELHISKTGPANVTPSPPSTGAERAAAKPECQGRRCQDGVGLEAGREVGPSAAGGVGVITYTITLTNTGPVVAANLVITDSIPAGATVVATSPGGSVLLPSPGMVRWAGLSLPGNGQTLSVHFTVTATETITNDDYGARCLGGIAVKGAQVVMTTISGGNGGDYSIYLPLVLRTAGGVQ